MYNIGSSDHYRLSCNLLATKSWRNGDRDPHRKELCETIPPMLCADQRPHCVLAVVATSYDTRFLRLQAQIGVHEEANWRRCLISSDPDEYFCSHVSAVQEALFPRTGPVEAEECDQSRVASRTGNSKKHKRNLTAKSRGAVHQDQCIDSDGQGRKLIS